MRAVSFRRRLSVLLAFLAWAACPAAAQFSLRLQSPGLPAAPAPGGLFGVMPGGSLSLPAPALSPGSLTLTPITPSPAPALRAAELLRSVASLLSPRRARTAPPQAVPEVQGGEVQGRAGTQALRPSRPGFEPHPRMPRAVLPDGTALEAESYVGGYHGTSTNPDKVVRDHGFPAKGPIEDWRLLEHSEESSEGASAFRGTTIFPSFPGVYQGAAYWADEGGWVYELRGVPTWELDSDLEGRVKRPDGTYRGNLMRGEVERAVPAQIPLECIPRWGQARAAANGRYYVPPSGWVENPAFDSAVCARFFGRS